MAGYSPLKITGMASGLVMERENFLLPDDAYPVLENAYVWRERIKRKKGYELLGRLQRTVTGAAGNTDGTGNFLGSLIAIYSLESTGTIAPGSFTATVGADTYTEPATPDGTLLKNGGASATGTFINYATGQVGLVTGLPAIAVVITFDYYPGLPVMGLRFREIQNSFNDQTVFFDQKYAYEFNAATNLFQEFIPGKTWNAHAGAVSATDFFWSTNYWVSDVVNFTTFNKKLFWVTNNTGSFGAAADPIRITDGTTWIDFAPPAYGQIDATNFLVNCLAMLPFRGRLLAFNTYEGPNSAGGINYANRIRWSTIGNPFIPYTAGPPSRGSWRDDIRGQGGYLDIPTSEEIVSVGFVRDNLVIYCERSTWQLRYTGRSIAPFQIEKVNSELGAQGPFSAIQFDTSLVGIGDKGIVECDSYKSERIDIKIPDLVFQFQAINNGPYRVHGVRDFINRLAFWTFPLSTDNPIFPTRRLLYNYENDSWAIFNDSLTTLGTYQPTSSRTWLNTNIPWIEANFNWLDQQEANPEIIGGNQQGFVEYLDSLTTNDVSLYIKSITAKTTTPTVINCPNHNMKTGFVIEISGIPDGTPFDNLNKGTDPSTGLPYNANNGVFGIVVPNNDPNNFQLFKYNDTTKSFSTPQLDVPGDPYVGLGLIAIRENFSITSKKFNFLDEGQSIQLGYIDVLMSSVANQVSFNGTAGNTDGSGNFLGSMVDIFELPPGSTIVPKSFSAQVSTNLYTEALPPIGNLLVNGSPAPSGSFINYETATIGLVTALPATAVYVSFNYIPGVPNAEISLNMYLDYNDADPSNVAPQNDINDGTVIQNPDTFFNSVIPTSQSPLSGVGGTKFWQRVYCATRASFLTLQYTFSNSQMAYPAQEKDVQIDAQILWLRRAGRITQG